MTPCTSLAPSGSVFLMVVTSVTEPSGLFFFSTCAGCVSICERRTGPRPICNSTTRQHCWAGICRIASRTWPGVALLLVGDMQQTEPEKKWRVRLCARPFCVQTATRPTQPPCPSSRVTKRHASYELDEENARTTRQTMGARIHVQTWWTWSQTGPRLAVCDKSSRPCRGCQAGD